MNQIFCPWCGEEMDLENETLATDAHDIPTMYSAYFECNNCGSRTPVVAVAVNYSEKPHHVQCFEAAHLVATRLHKSRKEGKTK